VIYRTWGDKLPFAAFIALSCLGTLVLAAMSWHWVEKPFMKLKKRTTHVGPEGKHAAEIPKPTESAPRPPVTLQRQYSMVRQVIFFV
jgi:peptidoglycan/LPS O-acetylase OafA/YrhL